MQHRSYTLLQGRRAFMAAALMAHAVVKKKHT
jgi:hypothetical protein